MHAEDKLKKKWYAWFKNDTPRSLVFAMVWFNVWAGTNLALGQYISSAFNWTLFLVFVFLEMNSQRKRYKAIVGETMRIINNNELEIEVIREEMQLRYGNNP